jgi:hypothetical protein
MLFLVACGSTPTPLAPTPPPPPPPPAPPPPIADTACIPRDYAASPITMAGESETHGFVCYSIVGDLVGAAEEAATINTRKCFAVDLRGALVEELTRADMRARETGAPDLPKLTLTGDRAKVCQPTGTCTELAIERGPKDSREALDYIGATDERGRHVVTIGPEPAGEMWATLYDVANGTRLGTMKLATPDAPTAFRNRNHTHVLKLVGRAVIVSELARPQSTAVFAIPSNKARYLHGDTGVVIAVNDKVLANRVGETLELVDTETLETLAAPRAPGTEVPHFFQGTVRKVEDSTVFFFGENPPSVTVIDAKTLQVTPARPFRLCTP